MKTLRRSRDKQEEMIPALKATVTYLGRQIMQRVYTGLKRGRDLQERSMV